MAANRFRRRSTVRTLVLVAGVLLLQALAFTSASGLPGKLDARTRAALARLRAGGQSIEAMRRGGVSVDRGGALEVFVRGSVTRQQLEAAGARVHTALPGLFTASIAPQDIDRVSALTGVVAIRAGAPCPPELDASVPTTGAQLLRGPGPAFTGYNGQGVLVGLVDSGVDYSHGDFKDSIGATRFVNLWDQSASGTGPPGYPYGIECTPQQINLGTCAEVDKDEHGTHAAGIAAGDGSQTGNGKPAFTYAGMAPRADLIMVKTDFTTPEVIDAISYVFDKATARGENAVVNLSLGTQYGSHDGASEFEAGVSALTGPGRIVVKSAGNDRGAHVHAQVFATAGGASATLSVSNSGSDKYFSVDGYYNATEQLRVRLLTPNGTIIGPLLINTENAAWPGQTTQNGVVYLVHDSLSTQVKNIYLEVNVTGGGQNMNGTWTITLYADHLGAANGEVDMWRYLAAPLVTANFVTGDLPTQELVTEPGNASSVITVGAYVSKTSWIGCNGLSASYPGIPSAGNLAPFSSPGLTRDGRMKPDLVAPGTAIGSTASFDTVHACPSAPTTSELLNDGMNHRMFQGTSMSAPHVTGAVALLLQKFGAMTPQNVKTYLQTHAHTDGFTGAVPTKDWGYGKLYLGDLIDPTAHVVSPNGGEFPHIGDVTQVRWTASDVLGSVASVDLLLSRTGPGGPFETIALGIPNTGSYGWTVTGPWTYPHAGYIKVVAHDTNGNLGADLSDAGFTIRAPAAVDDNASATFALSRVIPNPASSGVEIDYSVARESRVRLVVCDVQGRTVTVLADGARHAGAHRVTWEIDRARGTIAAGLYFVCFDTPAGRFVRRLAITR